MPKYSVFDDNIPVDADNFVVAIMRKPEGSNPEHAFVMIEGRTSSGQAILRRYDLFIDEESADNRALIQPREKIVSPEDTQYELLNNFLKGEEVYSISWSITKEQAEALHKDILKDKANPPKYQISGDASVIAKSRSAEGHSCFTWAREKLYNLNDPRIKEKLPEKYSDFIAAKTSLYIKGAKSEPAKCVIT